MIRSARRLLFIGVDGALPRTVLRYATEGALPNIARLIARGTWFDNCLPAFPTITPTCWATLATGATPARHGVTCQFLHLTGQPLDLHISAYRSETCQAERFWEAAARVGKRAVVVDFPTSGPARVQGVLQVNGTSCTSLEYRSLDPQYNLPISHGYFGVGPQLFSDSSATSQMEWPPFQAPASGQWPRAEQQTAPPQPVGGEGRLVRLHVEPRRSLWHVSPFDWFLELRGDQVFLKYSREDDHAQAPLAVGRWTPPLERALATEHGPHTFRYRAKLLEADASRAVLSIFFTPLADFRPGVNRPEFGELLHTMGKTPSFHGHGAYFVSGLLDDETYNEIEAMNLDWLASTIERAWTLHDCDIAVGYTVMIDTINHKYRNLIEELTGEPVARARAIAAERRAYELIDALVGRLVNADGPDTMVVLASDHGSVGYDTIFDPKKALQEAGLLVTRPRSDGSGEEIVWERTRAVPFGSVHIYVNLKGRDPQGIVEPHDYDRTIDEVIGALHNHAHGPLGGRTVALAFRRADAALVGLGGERVGDVVWGVSGRMGGYVGGVHACQIPTAATPTGDIRALLLMAGPGVRAGVRIGRIVRQCDVAPTLCQAMGWPLPAQAEGCVVGDALA